MEGKRTKDEVIGVVFSKFRPERSDVLADIGCHSCKVSAFFSPYVKKVYAVDIDLSNVDLKLLKECENVELVKSHGVEFFKERKDVSLVFFGGTDRIEEMIELAREANVRKVCVSAARIEVALKAKNAMESAGIFDEIVAVNVWRSYKLAGYTAFKPLNPVFLVFGSRQDLNSAICELTD